MSNRRYTDNEIKILNNNPNVIKVKYKKQIDYKESFKKWAVVQSITHPDMSAIEIFELAGFDRKIVSPVAASSRIRNWKGKYIKSKDICIITKTEKTKDVKKDNSQDVLAKIEKLVKDLINNNDKENK